MGVLWEKRVWRPYSKLCYGVTGPGQSAIVAPDDPLYSVGTRTKECSENEQAGLTAQLFRACHAHLFRGVFSNGQACLTRICGDSVLHPRAVPSNSDRRGTPCPYPRKKPASRATPARHHNPANPLRSGPASTDALTTTCERRCAADARCGSPDVPAGDKACQRSRAWGFLARANRREIHVTTRETDLYPPVKTFLEGQGYVVKSEVGAADVVAVRGGEPPVIVELKLGFSLALVHQCVARLGVSDDVYMAVERGKGKRFLKATKDMTRLCRRLGLGLLTVRLSDGLVQVHCDPGPYAPRKNTKRQGRLLKEFAARQGDPNDGGQTRVGLITAYRQDALKLALFLYEVGASKGADVARETGVPRATTMMRDDHYGWFEKVEKGIYGLTPKGAEAVARSGKVLGG